MLVGAVIVVQMKPNSFSGADTLVALVAWLVQGPPLQEHVFSAHKNYSAWYWTCLRYVYRKKHIDEAIKIFTKVSYPTCSR